MFKVFDIFLKGVKRDFFIRLSVNVSGLKMIRMKIGQKNDYRREVMSLACREYIKGRLKRTTSTLYCLKEDVQACQKYGNTTQCLIPLFRETWLKLLPETFPFKVELNSA